MNSDRWLRDREKEVLLFSENGVFKAACEGNRLKEAQHRLNIYQKQSPFFENIFLADKNGKIFMDSMGGKSVGIEITKVPGGEIGFQKAESGSLWISEPMKSPATGRPVTMITAPIYARHDFVGIVGGSVDHMNFSDQCLGQSGIGESGYIFILDSKGVVIAHPDSKQILETDMKNFDFGKRMLQKKTGTFHYVWQGKDRMARLATYDKKGWLLIATIDDSEILFGSHNMKAFSLR